MDYEVIYTSALPCIDRSQQPTHTRNPHLHPILPSTQENAYRNGKAQRQDHCLLRHVRDRRRQHLLPTQLSGPIGPVVVEHALALPMEGRRRLLQPHYRWEHLEGCGMVLSHAQGQGRAYQGPCGFL